MGTQTDYFNSIGYTGKYTIGDRVIGKYNKIPFVGTVGNDRCIDGKNPEVIVHLDLPIKDGKDIKNFIIVKHKDIRDLKELKL
jgi:UDP-glucose 4-epimerase